MASCAAAEQAPAPIVSAASQNGQNPAGNGDSAATTYPVAQASANFDSAVAKFDSIYAEYQSLNTKLDDAKRKYGATLNKAERETARKTYLELLPRSEELLTQLRPAARDAFNESPTHAPAVKVLVGIAMYDLKQDKFDAVVELTGAMRSKGCSDPLIALAGGMAAFQSDNYPIAETLLREAEAAGKLTPEAKSMIPQLAERKNMWIAEQEIRAKEAAANDLPRVEFETAHGKIVLELFENEAPQAVGNFVSLVEKKFYDGLSFHRVLPGFMAQGGDPKGDGTGGPGYKIYCECDKPNYRRHFRGSLSMAHAGKDTGGSQFFITFVPTPQLDARHTCFGRVIEGFEALDSIKRRDPTAPNPPEADKIISAKVIRKRPHDYVAIPVK